MALLRGPCCCLLAVLLALVAAWGDDEAPPEGYYAFMEAPLAQPPRVRRPPYAQSDHDCPGLRDPVPQRSLANLCGDLNKGLLPKNPMGQSVYGFTYPFELLRNKTLQFLSRTLPILREDETLPKVARFEEEDIQTNTLSRSRRSATLDEHGEAAAKDPASVEEEEKKAKDNELKPPEEGPLELEEGRGARKYCDKGGGVLCMLYKMINGEPLSGGVAERRDGSVPGDGDAEDGARRPPPPPPPHYRRTEPPAAPGQGPSALPPTPCPARVEYATPVFARNYQGVWRYVVQIPYEGYFTQTVEVVRCLQTRCHYLEGGGCLSSPRWVSLLVAEVFYPNTVLPAYQQRQPRPPVAAADAMPPVHDFQNYQDALRKRAGAGAGVDPPTTEKPSHCDGVDELGCFQVRLYYDWFLVPGSCKCWKPDYFSRFVRRKVVGPEL
ncbi:uncharacterized protein LOC126483993 [Schistocerca serialis cubense]|uniref:uncharacterized protein LOC126483993 n=1 Tax=Schistocerca serialis cubense TaxID=2023355 RepID=UPI00214EC3CB|nr:uncharacterized protein LOC126483993 [Schistocerca serialis cubense]